MPILNIIGEFLISQPDGIPMVVIAEILHGEASSHRIRTRHWRRHFGCGEPVLG